MRMKKHENPGYSTLMFYVTGTEMTLEKEGIAKDIAWRELDPTNLLPIDTVKLSKTGDGQGYILRITDPDLHRAARKAGHEFVGECYDLHDLFNDPTATVINLNETLKTKGFAVVEPGDNVVFVNSAK